MWCSKVLVAFDGSKPSENALDLALSIASQDTNIELVFVSVLKLYASGTGADTALIQQSNSIREKLEDVAKSIPNPTSVKLLKGASPADLILRCSREEACDLIIMGSRGNGGMKGYLGSVSYAVIQASPKNVLIAKDNA